jgi:hypothetical protein
MNRTAANEQEVKNRHSDVRKLMIMMADAFIKVNAKVKPIIRARVGKRSWGERE